MFMLNLHYLFFGYGSEQFHSEIVKIRGDDTAQADSFLGSYY